MHVPRRGAATWANMPGPIALGKLRPRPCAGALGPPPGAVVGSSPAYADQDEQDYDPFAAAVNQGGSRSDPPAKNRPCTARTLCRPYDWGMSRVRLTGTA